MAGNNQSTFIQLPLDVSNPLELRRFLDKLVQQLDVAFGNRGDNAFASSVSLTEIVDILNNHELRLDNIEEVLPDLVNDVQSLKEGELIVSTTANLLVSATTETILCDCSPGPIEVQLPDPLNCFNNSRSKTISVSKVDSSANRVVIIPNGGESIVGEASVELLRNSEIVNLITDGTNWYLGA